MADDFGHSWVVLLAKSDQDDHASIVARRPDDARPVSLSNGDPMDVKQCLAIQSRML